MGNEKLGNGLNGKKTLIRHVDKIITRLCGDEASSQRVPRVRGHNLVQY